MRTATRTRIEHRECHAPDCSAPAADGKIFCRVCQAVLDRVRTELEAGPGGNRRINGNAPFPTIQNTDEARAASFDAGLKRRAANNEPLTEAGLLTRAVRIIQLRQEGLTDRQIIRRLYLTGQDELDEDLERYRKRVEAKAAARVRGLPRDIQLDKTIVERLKTHEGPRTELAKELGISYSALVSRITRLRRDGYEIPDARRRKATVAA